MLVGRIRRDPDEERTLNLWIVGDNLLLGEPFKFTKDNIAQFDF